MGGAALVLLATAEEEEVGASPQLPRPRTALPLPLLPSRRHVRAGAPLRPLLREAAVAAAAEAAAEAFLPYHRRPSRPKVPPPPPPLP